MRLLRHLLDSLGPAGVCGVGVLLFCLPFYLTALAPAEKSLERGRSAPPAVRAVGDDGSADLARFHAAFPPATALTAELERVYAHARASNLQLQQGEYRLESRGAGLAAYRVTLPVRGSYAEVRRFAGRLLADMPAASLDMLRFERKKALDGQLEAQLRLTIYLRPAGKGTS